MLLCHQEVNDSLEIKSTVGLKTIVQSVDGNNKFDELLR